MNFAGKVFVVFSLAHLLIYSPLCAQKAQRQQLTEREFLEALEGVPKRALLGIQFVYRQEPGNDPTHYRLLINGIQPGGPGEKAGVHVDDVIVAVDGHALVFGDPLEIDFFFDPIAPGQVVTLEVLRGTSTLAIPVTAAELPLDLVRAKQRNRKSLMVAAGTETAELLGRGTGTRLEIRRETESGRLEVELIDNPQRLSALRLAALTVAFEESPLFRTARQLEPGGKATFRLLYDEATTTFNLEPI